MAKIQYASNEHFNRISIIPPIPGMTQVPLSISKVSVCVLSQMGNRHECLWLYQAAFLTQEESSSFEGSTFYRRMDLLVEFRAAGFNA